MSHFSWSAVPLLLLCALSTVRADVRTADIILQGKPIKLSGFQGDVVFRHMAEKSEWDADIIDLAKLLCPHGNETIFDIGANLGFMTLQFSLLADKGHVFSWEPHPSNYMLLDRNVRDNQRFNVHTYNNAVADEDMTICIPRFPDDPTDRPPSEAVTHPRRRSNNGDIKLSDRGTANTVCEKGSVSIKTMKLEAISSELRSLDFLKIDVQGYELRVLKSALPQVLKYRPYIAIEFEEWNMKRMKDSYSTLDIVAYIRDQMRYEIFLIPSGYPADHLLVPVEKLDNFRAQFSKSLQPLSKPNSVNRNVEAGVTEQICLDRSKCNQWKGMFAGKKALGPT